jgi:hypothetical protein
MYLNIPKKTPQSMKPTTLSNWLALAMKDTGIDTDIFSAHSFRTATSTKAIQEGHAIQDAKKHANWSLNSDTFKKFYYKPVAHASSNATINNSIFSLPENHIILNIGMESTGVDLGTANNTNVAVMETENVIHIRPWY